MGRRAISVEAQERYVADLMKVSERREQHSPMPKPGDPRYCPVNIAEKTHDLYRNRSGSVGCYWCGFPPKRG